MAGMSIEGGGERGKTDPRRSPQRYMKEQGGAGKIPFQPGSNVTKDKTERMKPRKPKAADIAASLKTVLPGVGKTDPKRSPQRYAKEQGGPGKIPNQPGSNITKDKTERMKGAPAPKYPSGPDARRSPQRFAKAVGKPVPGTLQGRRGSSERKAY